MHRSAPCLAAALAALLFTSPSPARASEPVEKSAGSPDPFHIPYEKFTLANGLEVILAPEPSRPLVAVNVWYHVGSRDEPAGKTGLAHLFEHMMFHGSRNVGIPWMHQSGASDQNATTSRDRTNYFQTFPAHRLESALWMESDRMGFFLDALEKESLDSERGVVKNERRERAESSTFGPVLERAWAALFGEEHPYGDPVIGSMADLDAITLDDLRTFFDTWYDPSNATLVVSGSFDREEAIRLVEGYFASLPSVALPPRSPPPPARLEESVVLREKVDREHSLVQMLLLAPPLGTKEYLVGTVVRGLLREKLRSSFHLDEVTDLAVYSIGLEWQSVFVITLELAKGVDTERIAGAVEKILAAFHEEELPPDWHATERNARRYRNLAALQGVGERAHFLQHYNRFYREPDGLRLEMAQLDAVTEAEMRAFIREVLQRPKVILYAGPAVGGGPPRPLVQSDEVPLREEGGDDA